MNSALRQLKKDVMMLKEDAQQRHDPYSFAQDSEWEEDYVKLRDQVRDLTEHIISFSEQLKKKMKVITSNSESNNELLQVFVEEFEQRGYQLDKYEVRALLAMVFQLTETVLFTEEKDDEDHDA